MIVSEVTCLNFCEVLFNVLGSSVVPADARLWLSWLSSRCHLPAAQPVSSLLGAEAAPNFLIAGLMF